MRTAPFRRAAYAAILSVLWAYIAYEMMMTLSRWGQ